MTGTRGAESRRIVRTFGGTVWQKGRTPITFLGFLVLWQLAVVGLGVEEFVLPTPVSALSHLLIPQPDVDYHWIKHISATLMEVGLSFAVTVVVGIIIAIILTWSRTANKLCIPLFIFVNSLPIVATAPIILLWFGYGIFTNILIAFIISFFPMVINTATGLNAVEEELLDLVRYHGASKWQIFLKIRLPGALHYIFSGLKICSTLCVVGAIIGEFIAAETGLGYLIVNSQFTVDTPAIFASLIVISVMGLGLFGLVSLLERLVMPWEKREAVK